MGIEETCAIDNKDGQLPQVDTLSNHNSQIENPKLRAACREFEGMLMSIILKQGLKPTLAEKKEEAGGDILQEFAIEQAARQLGHKGTFGIADLLYEQMSRLQIKEKT